MPHGCGASVGSRHPDGTTTATTVKCTAAAVTATGPKTVQTTTGSVTSVVGTGSTFTFLDQ